MTGSGNSLSITQVRGDYYGPLYFKVAKSADVDGTCNVYAGYGARTYAINDTQSHRAGTLTIPHNTSSWQDITNKTHGPNLKNIDVHCGATGSFTSALHAYSEEVEFEVMERMKATLQKYCAADESLRDMDFSPDKIQVGKRENMVAEPGDIGIALLTVLEMPRSPMGSQIYRPNIMVTAWVRDVKNPEASAQKGMRVLARLRSIIFDEQRTWGGLVLATNARELRTMPWMTATKGTPTHFGEKVRILMELQTDHGPEQEDPTWPGSTSVRGGRYADVDLVAE